MAAFFEDLPSATLGRRLLFALLLLLPVGGWLTLGGVRAGINTFIIPKENEADLADLPEEIRRVVTVHPVTVLGEVLALTLRGASFKEGRLLFGDDNPRDVAPLSISYPH